MPALSGREFARPIPASRWAVPAKRLARELLGVRLVRRVGRSWRAVRIVECEAYEPGDPASHAFLGPSVRNRSMYAPPGTLYVFSIHQVVCANVVGRPGEAALIRAGEPLTRGLPDPSGPGRLCRALGIDRSWDGVSLERSELRLLPRTGPVGALLVGPRVGLSHARDRPLRFALAGNDWVSSPRRGLAPLQH
ncbi:MAG TPA: DNA-3-methyladenine glycosylase [Thermoplasmata archaeon]|nr:DNA-3-methyladenine glycosylase [Thermoplasmata archaeon]